MKEKPILFSGPMIRAILDGRKTQTRRIVKLPIALDADDVFAWFAGQEIRDTWPSVSHDGLYQHSKRGLQWLGPCPYGVPGDRLWVRETWSYHPDPCGDPPSIICRADEEWDGMFDGIRWRPSIHMPRWASRLTLLVKSVRVERVQDITEEGAIAEGCTHRDCGSRHCGAGDSFAQLWDSIHGHGAWALNPWVWVIEFERVKQ